MVAAGAAPCRAATVPDAPVRRGRGRRRWRGTAVVVGVVGAFAALASWASAPATQAPRLHWPIACEHGADCWIVRHVDRDPGPGRRDVGCGTLTGDDHRGTDIALADMSAVARGVAVLAPAAGTVAGVRDGMPDVAIDAPGAPALDGRNCGNGVRLDHGDGWRSRLCHLRRGSITVRPGDRVDAGDLIGRVGLSGDTSFPHLHVGVEHEGRRIDPMDGAMVGDGPGCGAVDPLFASAPRYIALPLVGAGVAPTAPEDADLLRGWHRERRLPAYAPALVVWIQAYGTAPGDELAFRLDGPGGEPVVDQQRTLDDGHARGSYFAGRRRPEGGWPPGRYAGTVEWRRGDDAVKRRFELEITAAAGR